MTKDQLYKELNYVSATRVCRSKYANMVIDQKELIKPILEIVFMVDDKLSSRAAWVFEFACKDDITIILPHLDYFTSNISRLKLDSTTRPCAKIIEILIELYYKKQDPIIKEALNKVHREAIVESCFDWMIRNEKIAVKAYSMNALYYLGTEFSWIYPELKNILQKDYPHQSSGYKARARHILAKIDS